MQWYSVAGLLTILTSSQGILTTLSQTGGKYKYDYSTVPFLAEVFKLIVSSLLLWRECKKSSLPKMTTDWKSVWLYLIPSVIYLIHNNVQFATLTYVDTSTYQIMGNLKIVSTGILFRLFLRRKLSSLQWIAIVLLAVGTTTSQIKGCGSASCDSVFSAPFQGYTLGVLSACLSALAGVYTEFLMKKNNDSLYWQNVQLYAFGSVFNMAKLLTDDFRGGFENGPWWQRLFNGYTITTWIVVVNLASSGLLVSWLMKYADNIVKVYSTSMAMLLTMILSVFLFNFKPTLQGILTTLSQTGGKYKYDYSTVPFLAEVFKLIVSSLLLWRECKKSSLPKMTTDWKSVWLYLIPSVIYLIHNNVQFATLTYVDTSTYQIMGNLKIVSTGILFRLFLRRKLSSLQWIAIVLLAVGTTTSQIKGCGSASCDSVFSAPFQGYTLGVLSACLSALAGVYTEFLMKKNNDSLYWQNVQLYAFGSVFNMAKLLTDDFRGGFENGPWWQRLFNGYTITTWIVVVNLASSGLLVSWLMKYADNIVKVYSTSMAMLLTMILSVFLFNFKPTLQLFLGIIVCMMSLHMYFTPSNTLVDLPLTVKEEQQQSLVDVSVD